MKLEITEKDKRLLIMLAIFVIVVGIGYWGVYPYIKSIRSANTEIEEQEEIKTENETKQLMVPILEKDSETLQTEIEEAREMYFSMMSSAEIDKYFTNLVLSYGLYSYDLTISISGAETELSPYQYSALATGQVTEDVSSDEDTSSSTGSSAELEEIEAAEESADESSEDEDEVTFDEPVTTGIYDAQITMRLGGDETTLKRLIEDFSNTDQKIRVCSYSWADQKSVENLTESGEYDIVTNRILTITLEIYMYQEDPEETTETE